MPVFDHVSSPQPVSPNPSNVVHTRSTRAVKKPSYLQDYHCTLASHSSVKDSSPTSYPLSQFLDYRRLSLPFKAAVLSMSSQSEPEFYYQASDCGNLRNRATKLRSPRRAVQLMKCSYKYFKGFINDENKGKCVSANMPTGKKEAQHMRVVVHLGRSSKRMTRKIVDTNASMVVATDMKSKAKPSVNFLGTASRKLSRSKGDVRMARNITTAVKEKDRESMSDMVKNRNNGELMKNGRPLLPLIPPGTVKAAAKTNVETRTATVEHD
ncbi:hypothetical protein LWI29_031589 [Acer saccharum]|uniref:Uncharacterized protein n=1 Tax=Acer saccharum TaxID=4024 RepID=A0AA39RUD7_ACESA|nr:hypothetical protein LWI29_031589 [Acer saccharum]